MNARNKKVLGVLLFGLVILAWRLNGIFSDYLPPAQVRADTESGAAQPPRRPVSAKAADLFAKTWVVQRQLQGRPWGRDPFESPPSLVVVPQNDSQPDPVVDAKRTPGAIRFTGTAQIEGKWRAIVEGRIIGVGDSIESGLRVVEITKRTITLASGAWRFRYELGSQGAITFEGSENP